MVIQKQFLDNSQGGMEGYTWPTDYNVNLFTANQVDILSSTLHTLSLVSANVRIICKEDIFYKFLNVAHIINVPYKLSGA